MQFITIAGMHKLFAVSLQHLVQEIMPSATVDVIEKDVRLLKTLNSGRYNLLILDISWASGLVSPLFISQILECFPALDILLISGAIGHADMEQFFKIGISGFIGRNISLTEFKTAIETISQGKVYVQADFLYPFTLLHINVRKNNGKAKNKALSAREQQIATLLLRGETSTAIGRKLKLKPSTVSTHKRRIYEKMNVTSLIGLLHKTERLNANMCIQKPEPKDESKVIPITKSVRRKAQDA